MQFQGKRVLITGAGRGIGRAIALECARGGASLGIVARTAQELEATATELKRAGAPEVALYPGDVGHLAFAEDVVAHWVRPGEAMHGLVCAAAIMGEINELAESSLADWEKALRINVMGSVSFAQAAIRRMPRGGRIVFFSGGGQGAQARRTAYTASKGAIWRLTESLAAEVEGKGIFVNAIAPGAVNTSFLQAVLDAGPERAGRKEYEEALRQKEKGGTPPEKAAKLVAYLMAERSAGLTGKILSAVWDPYEDFQDLAAMSRSDIYTVRRVVDAAGGTRVK